MFSGCDDLCLMSSGILEPRFDTSALKQNSLVTHFWSRTFDAQCGQWSSVYVQPRLEVFRIVIINFLKVLCSKPKAFHSFLYQTTGTGPNRSQPVPRRQVHHQRQRGACGPQIPPQDEWSSPAVWLQGEPSGIIFFYTAARGFALKRWQFLSWDETILLITPNVPYWPLACTSHSTTVTR